MRFFTIPIKLLRPLSYAGYLFLIVAAHVPVETNHLSRFITLGFVGTVAFADLVITQRAEVTAFLIAKRHYVSITVLSLTVLFGSLAIWTSVKSGGPTPNIMVLFQFMLEGALVGVIIRVLVLTRFEQLLKGANIEIPRILLLIALTVSIWLFPLVPSHRSYAGFYIYGLGVGFFVHYLLRRKEHKRAEASRLGQYIVELLGSAENISVQEDQIIRLYANQNWRALDKLFSNNQRQRTTLLAIVKASMLRIKGQYGEARAIVERELDRKEHDEKQEQYLHLHRALNLADLKQWERMYASLENALKCGRDLLTLVTMGLRLAEEVPLNPADVSAEHEAKRQRALSCIWEALQINDVARPELVSSIIGRALPMTWTFLMDAYAYVLLKAGHVGFSKALLATCIYEDPYFSSPYLHLAEWSVADVLRQQDLYTRKSANTSTKQLEAMQANIERSQRVGRLCLKIAIRLEKNKGSLTRSRALTLMSEYESLLHEA